MEGSFQKYLREKKRFVRRAIIFVIIFYFSLPLSLICFPSFMELKIAILGISYAWLHAFLQFVMTWILGWMYFKRATKWDRYIEQLEQE